MTKTRYETFYRSITGLDSNKAVLIEVDQRALPFRTGPHSVPRRPSVLEATHPEIVQTITLLWGHPEMNVYFEKLWLDDGSGTPIAPEAMSELMLLAGVHRWLSPSRPARNMASMYDASHAPILRKNQKDLWEDVPRRR